MSRIYHFAEVTRAIWYSASRQRVIRASWRAVQTAPRVYTRALTVPLRRRLRLGRPTSRGGRGDMACNMKTFRVLLMSAVTLAISSAHGDLPSLPNGHVLTPGIS